MATGRFEVRGIALAHHVNVEGMDARREIASWYDEALAGQSLVRPVPPGPGTTSTFYKYLAYLPEGAARADIKRTLREMNGVALTGEVYADLCHREPLWQRYDAWGRLTGDSGSTTFGSERFPGAERLSTSHVCLPLYPGLTRDDVQYVVESLTAAVGGQVAVS